MANCHRSIQKSPCQKNEQQNQTPSININMQVTVAITTYHLPSLSFIIIFIYHQCLLLFCYHLLPLYYCFCYYTSLYLISMNFRPKLQLRYEV